MTRKQPICSACQEIRDYTVTATKGHLGSINHIYAVWVVQHRWEWIPVRDNEWPVLDARFPAGTFERRQAPLYTVGMRMYRYDWARRDDLITYLTEFQAHKPLTLRMQAVLARARDTNSKGFWP